MATDRSKRTGKRKARNRATSPAARRGLAEDLSDLFPCMPPEQAPCAALIYRSVFGDLPLSEWAKEGSTLRRVVDGKLLHFASRRTHCTLGFRGRAAMEFYRFRGGECECGEVTIKIPYDREFDPVPVQDAVEWYFYSS
jgi:hypothetical protein